MRFRASGVWAVWAFGHCFFVFLFFLAGEQRDGVGLSGRFILLIAVYTAEPLVP